MGKGRWTSQEHADFLEGLEKYGKDWKAIADVVKTRTTVQTRTHHQKYEKQMKKGRKFPEEPYEDDDVDGSGGNGRSGRSGRKAPRTKKAIRPPRAMLVSQAPVAARGKILLTPPAAGGKDSGGGGSRGRPRSTRAASAAAARAKAEAEAAKASFEASAARAVEAAARAAAAVAAAAATGRVRKDADDGSSSDAGQQREGGQQRPEKRAKTDHLSADFDAAAAAAAAGSSSAYGRHRFSFQSSIAAPDTATPLAAAQVPPSPRKEAAFAKSLWSSIGNLAAQGQAAAGGEVGMEGAAGSYVGDRGLSGGASGFTSRQLSPFMCETFLDGFGVGGEDAETSPAAAPVFSVTSSSSSSSLTFAGGHKVKTERSGRDDQDGDDDDGLLLARQGSSFSSAAAAAAAGYSAQQLLRQQQQQQQQQQLQQQQRLQQAQQQQQQQQRVLLSSGSAAVAAFGCLPDLTATFYPGSPFDPTTTTTAVPTPGIGGLEPFSPSGYAAGFGPMSESNGAGGGGGVFNPFPFSAASTNPAFFRRSDCGGGVLDDKLEFPGGGVAMSGVVGEAGVGSLKHDEQAFDFDKRLAAFRQQQQQQQQMPDQVFHVRTNCAPATATATSMFSSSSSSSPSFGDAGSHKLRRPAAFPPGAFDVNMDEDGGSSSSSSSKDYKQDNVATGSVFGMSSDSGSSSGGGDTLSADGLTDDLTGYGSEGWPDDGMEDLEQFDVLAVFAFDDHFGIL
ncbi:unnamed protein product [Ectocarpus fasciculatus]